MKRLKKPSNFALVLAGVFVVASVLGLAAALVFRAHDQNSINERICQSSVENRDALRLILTRARDAGIASTEDRDTQDRIRVFYADLLTQVPRLECRRGKPVEVE